MPATAERQRVQRHTFYILACEGCGIFEDAPERFKRPDFAQVTTEHMRCAGCGESLLLAECFVAPQATMWQAQPGAMWQHVIYPEDLPDQRGRQLWTDA